MGTITDTVGFDAIQTTYRMIDDGFDATFAACEDANERAKLRALLSSARDAYWKAIADGLEDNNAVVDGIRADLQEVNRRLKESLANLEDIVGVLNLMTEAVRLSGSLVSLGAPR